MNFFKLYVGDYQRDTGSLSISEHGAYFLMLQYHYATEKPLPTGKELYRLLRCESKTDRNAVDSIVKLYWSETPNGLINGRSTIEIAKAGDQAEINARIAKEREEKKRLERERIEQEALNDSLHGSCSNREPNQTPEPEPLKPKVKSEALARSASASSPVRLGEGRVIETIPLVSSNAEVCESFAAEMDRLFPAVDVPQTLREIRAWNLANTAKRKTDKGIQRHIISWFHRVQNGGR